MMRKLFRFYVPPENAGPEKIKLTAFAARHAVKTLRLHPGDPLILFDGSGTEYEARLLPGGNTASIEKKRHGKPEGKPRLFLYQAPLKKEPWEWLLEKATELGASAITPLITKYVEADVTQNFTKKKQRWETIVQRACEQSERGSLPDLGEAVALKEALRNCPKPALFFYEEENLLSLKSALAAMAEPESLSVFIGPVGGFSPKEAEEARSLGIPAVSLGSRVLRAETASLAALSVINSWFQD